MQCHLDIIAVLIGTTDGTEKQIHFMILGSEVISLRLCTPQLHECLFIADSNVLLQNKHRKHIFLYFVKSTPHFTVSVINVDHG